MRVVSWTKLDDVPYEMCYFRIETVYAEPSGSRIVYRVVAYYLMKTAIIMSKNYDNRESASMALKTMEKSYELGQKVYHF